MQVYCCCRLSGLGFTQRFALLRVPISLQHHPVAARQAELWRLGVVERGARSKWKEGISSQELMAPLYWVGECLLLTWAKIVSVHLTLPWLLLHYRLRSTGSKGCWCQMQISYIQWFKNSHSNQIFSYLKWAYLPCIAFETSPSIFRLLKDETSRVWDTPSSCLRASPRHRYLVPLLRYSALLEVPGPSCGRFVVWGTQPSLCFPVKHGSCVFLTSAKSLNHLQAAIIKSLDVLAITVSLSKGLPTEGGCVDSTMLCFVCVFVGKKRGPALRKRTTKQNKQKTTVHSITLRQTDDLTYLEATMHW